MCDEGGRDEYTMMQVCVVVQGVEGFGLGVGLAKCKVRVGLFAG